MHVKELKNLLANLPDDMIVTQYSEHTGGYYLLKPPQVEGEVSSDGSIDEDGDGDEVAVKYNSLNPILVFPALI